MSHSYEWWPRKALTVTPAPTSSTKRPTQSAAVQVARHRPIQSDRQARKTAARRKATETTPSSPRTSGANAEATRAPAIHHRDGATSARKIRKRQSVEYGYASGSSTIIDEYAS